jgi:hypothetical protein
MFLIYFDIIKVMTPERRSNPIKSAFIAAFQDISTVRSERRKTPIVEEINGFCDAFFKSLQQKTYESDEGFRVVTQIREAINALVEQQVTKIIDPAPYFVLLPPTIFKTLLSGDVLMIRNRNNPTKEQMVHLITDMRNGINLHAVDPLMSRCQVQLYHARYDIRYHVPREVAMHVTIHDQAAMSVYCRYLFFQNEVTEQTIPSDWPKITQLNQQERSFMRGGEQYYYLGVLSPQNDPFHTYMTASLKLIETRPKSESNPALSFVPGDVAVR